ncbi:DoxX family protein [Sunxiuqinia sp. A32]|uniref:DoxX family protein n=1 Tax=Sunxiuqinia sp. A32 TaxID=3461496 RepID=UPI004046097F
MSRLLGNRANEVIENLWLLVLRVSAGTFMLTHGIPKLLKLLEGNTGFADPFGFGETISLILAVFAEVICSVLIIVGAGTRLATLPLIITMAVAVFMVHGSDPFQRKELALLYLLAFITVLVFGGGKYSLGKYIKGN